MAKRKATHKKISGVKVVTNPKFTKDAKTELPQSVWRKYERARDALYAVIDHAFEAGIAIDRARATASGAKRRK